MTGRERLTLLLTGSLGQPGRRPLTVAQYRSLTQRFLAADFQPGGPELTLEELGAVGCTEAEAERILALLQDEALLDGYLARGKALGCVPLTRVSEGYPQRVRRCLGLDSPGSLWARGDLEILSMPCLSLVGSRNILPDNEYFAYRVGALAASRGYALVSGNARGADTAAQDGCLDAGGKVISVVADRLDRHEQNNVLYLSEDGFDLDFTSRRALSRNRVIHSLGECVFVAQSGLRGGTWDGTANNLRRGYGPVYIFQDGSAGAEALVRLGAKPIKEASL